MSLPSSRPQQYNVGVFFLELTQSISLYKKKQPRGWGCQIIINNYL